MRFRWKRMHLCLVIIMKSIAHFSQEVDLCGSTNDKVNRLKYFYRIII
jgi:hypothetical protein